MIHRVGFYDLNVEMTVANQTYKSSHLLRATHTLKPQSLKFEMSQSKRIPESFQYTVNPGAESMVPLKANQNNFLHIRFQLKSNEGLPIEATHISVRLWNSLRPQVTNMVVATFDNYFYKAIIDLGDPDHILPYNGLYEMQVVVGDQFL
jgi:hypothetical protein